MKKQTVGLILILFVVALIGVKGFAQQRHQQRVAQAGQLHLVVSKWGLQPLQRPPAPDPALVALGRLLFFEKELSGNRDVSCATCHHPTLGATDALPLSIGTGGQGLGPFRVLDKDREFVERNALDLFNRALPGWQTMFWDGRVSVEPTSGFHTTAGRHLPAGLANVLAAQAMFPVTDRNEMRGGSYDVAGYVVQPGTSAEDGTYEGLPAGWHDVDVYGKPNELAAIADGPEHLPAVWDGLMNRLLAILEYKRLFHVAYPDVETPHLGFQHAANALAAFQAEAFTFVDSPWNRYLSGDETALSEDAVAGALLFFGEARCAACHTPPLFTDQAYHNIAVPQFGPGRDDFAPLDYGRYHVTGDPTDRYAFRTPPLHNVTLTGPWLHNGAYNSLEAAIRHHLNAEEALRTYDGSHLPESLQSTLQNEAVTLDVILGTVDPLLQDLPPLNDRQIDQLLAFLEALTDPAATDPDGLVPDTVPSGLPVDG